MKNRMKGKFTQGAHRSMRLVSSFATVAGGLGALLLTAGSVAAPVIDGWNLQRTQAEERLRLRWNEPSSSVQIEEFPGTNQVLVTIPEASIDGGALPALELGESPILSGAKLQNVVLSDGRDGVQLTLSMRDWRHLEAVSGANWLVLSYDMKQSIAVPADKTAEAESMSDILRIDNGDIQKFHDGAFGSSRAPETGAGQDSSSAMAPFYVPPDLTAEEKEKAAGGEDTGMINTMGLFERYVDLDFKNAALQDVVRTIAAKLDLNIIMMPSQVQGSVTLRLSNVRLGDALDALLKSNGLAYKVEPGGIVRIVPRKDVQSREKETVVRSVPINWVDSDSVASVIEPFLSDEVGQVQSAQESNVLIIEDVPEKVAKVQELISAVDVPEKQVRIEMRMVDMTERASRDLGIETGFTNQETMNVVFPDGENGGVTPDAVGEALSRTAGSFGITNPAADGLDVRHINNAHIFGDDYLIDVQINALETRGEAVTLANPTVLSLNNTPATIEIKRQIPYLDARNTDQGSVATVKFQDVGVKVDVTPRITNNGYVQMEIEPEQIIFVEFALDNVPVVDERNAVTSVIIKDEQTVVLGGLRQFEMVNTEQGVPWLLRAPVLSWLFKRALSDQRRTTLYLFVTPHIVKDPEPSVYETGLYEKIDYNWDLPDYYFDEVQARKGPKEAVDPNVKWE